MSLPSSSVPPFETLVSTLRAAGCVFAEEEARILLDSAATPADLATMVCRRAGGLPLEHVVGWAEFRGIRVAVDPGVFVPRRRTEFLVERAVALLDHAACASRVTWHGERPATVVVDLCCGSGALGMAVAAATGDVELYASDVDPTAVRCARRNIGAGGRVYEGDLFEPLPATLRGRVEMLLANVPYVPSEEVAVLPTEAREHEAPLALDGGGDGLDMLRRVAREAPHWLAPGGHLLVETSERQASRAATIVGAAGLAARVVNSEEWYATVVVGTRPVRRG